MAQQQEDATALQDRAKQTLSDRLWPPDRDQQPGAGRDRETTDRKSRLGGWPVWIGMGLAVVAILYFVLR